MFRLAAAFVFALSLLPAACADALPEPKDTPPPMTFRTAPLVIETKSGAHRFAVEVAETPEQRERGLMFRDAMAGDAGMIFDYHQDVDISMWMKNTILPLDMVFISADGTVFDVVKGAVPYSLDIIPSGGRVRAVLEVNAGIVDALEIRRGDKVKNEIFGNAP